MTLCVTVCSSSSRGQALSPDCVAAIWETYDHDLKKHVLDGGMRIRCGDQEGACGRVCCCYSHLCSVKYYYIHHVSINLFHEDVA